MGKARSDDRKSGLSGAVQKLFSRRKGGKPARGSERTVAGTGTVVQSHAAGLGRVLAYAALVFAILGGAAGGVSLLRSDASAQGPVRSEVDTSASQQAGDYARGFVASWLRASAVDHQALTRYVTVEDRDVTDKEPQRFRDLAVASVQSEGSVRTVIISAQLSVPAEGEGESQSHVWEPVWYQVSVHEQGGHFAALGYPAPVPVPRSVEAPDLAYGEKASVGISQTVEAFVGAYLGGEGDLGRVVHPDSGITQAVGTAYPKVQVQSAATVEDHGERSPAEGEQAQALVEVALSTATGTRPASYSLTLQARGGRWEVLAVDPAPQLQPSSSAGTETGPAPGEPSQSPSTTQ